MPLNLIAFANVLRPKQWVKNSFVFAPLLFSKLFMNEDAVLSTCIAAVFFCLASSSVYIVNDIHDKDWDRKHSKKLLSRPIAAGVVSVDFALILLAILYIILVSSFIFMPNVFYIIVAYIVLNLGYTFFLKNKPVIDIFCIAIGFILRVIAGVAAINASVSQWMLITTLCLALYLAAIKRFKEINSEGTDSRAVLKQYSADLLMRYAELSATGAIVFYSLFVMQSRPAMAFTIPIVLFGVFRYWYVVEKLDGGESPTDALLTDWPLCVTVLIWILSCAWVLSMKG